MANTRMQTAGEQCAVCQEDASDHRLSCGHSFHASCIIDWFRRGESTCPVCRDRGGVPLEDDSSEDEGSSYASDSSSATTSQLEHFRLFSTRADVSRLVRASLRTVRRFPGVRSRQMQRMRVRAARFLQAAEEANAARTRANLFLRSTYSGPLLNGVKRYNALVRMWGTRERRLRAAALDLYVEHSI